MEGSPRRRVEEGETSRGFHEHTCVKGAHQVNACIQIDGS